MDATAPEALEELTASASDVEDVARAIEPRPLALDTRGAFVPRPAELVLEAHVLVALEPLELRARSRRRSRPGGSTRDSGGRDGSPREFTFQLLSGLLQYCHGRAQLVVRRSKCGHGGVAAALAREQR